VSSEKPNVINVIHSGYPLTLRWWGWETTTSHLHRNGWKFHAFEQMGMYSDALLIALAATSPDGVVMLRGSVKLPYYEAFQSQHLGMGALGYVSRSGIEMQQYVIKDRVHVMPSTDFKELQSLQPIDITQETYASREFKDLKCFQYKEEGPSIYIPPTSVDECLNTILRLQYPEQEKIKKSLIMPEQKTLLKAQVYSLVA